ncbi:MAG TPA: hypothetical protein VFG56_02750 [Candidatus Saccharimonadales bacterium]|nr:hypothetical protein [Candidatus Saccharimonadales bacterium]
MIRGRVVNGVQPGNDQSSAEAQSQAEQLWASRQRDTWYMAIVDRMDGLVLLCSDPKPLEAGADDIRGYHFQNAVAGYSGAGPITTVKILTLFGFGRFKDLFRKVARGDQEAFYGFVKVDGEVVFTKSPQDLLP